MGLSVPESQMLKIVPQNLINLEKNNTEKQNCCKIICLGVNYKIKGKIN